MSSVYFFSKQLEARLKLFILAITLLGSFAVAADVQPLITKTSGGGFTPPEWARYEKCDVFANHVLIVKHYGVGANAFELKEDRKITLTAGIQNSIKLAKTEQLEEKDNGLCDAPGTTITLGSGETATVLFTSGGCGSPRKERAGPHSTALKDIVNTYCPQTYDIRP
jgi:hypothetical protein